MAKDNVLRKRKTQLKEKSDVRALLHYRELMIISSLCTQAKSEVYNPTAAPTSSAFLNTLIYLLVFAAVGGAIYWRKPDAIRGVVYDFLGMELTGEPDYYSGDTQVVDWWRADEEKRDAVVAAFKDAYGAYGTCHLRVSLAFH